MGQSASSEADGASKTPLVTELFSKLHISGLIANRSVLLLTQPELQAVTAKLNISSVSEKRDISQSDLLSLLQFPEDFSQGEDSVGSGFQSAIAFLYGSFQVLSHFPFLKEYNGPSKSLSPRDLAVVAFIHTGRFRKLVSSDYAYLTLVFVSLSLSCSEINKKTIESDENCDLGVTSPRKEGETDTETARRINWGTLEALGSFDGIETGDLTVSARDLQHLLTLFLVISSVPKKRHSLMQEHLKKNLRRWQDFEPHALTLLRYVNPNINATNVLTSIIKHDEFLNGFRSLQGIFLSNFERLFKEGVLSAAAPEDVPLKNDEPEVPDEKESKIKKRQFPKFSETKLINEASVSFISACLENIGSTNSVSTQNLIRLYTGSEAGFSIRSLELKIFKWQAPTLLIVSGKRLKTKTMATNKRYEHFTTEYPRYFKNAEEAKNHWQTEKDVVTYAVLVNQPWRNSNKKNFGDENSIILSLLPRFDFYKSVHNPVLKGELVYFNNVGLGLGFGNDQPLSRANVRKYLPGGVSLTIEANLEFAVFRHIVSATSNGAAYFQKSQTLLADFEDRFMITDLEAWGIGSTKELEEQRKQWEWEEKQAEARQSVNMQSLGEERAFLEMVGLVGNNGASGGSV